MPPKNSKEVLEHIQKTLGCDEKRANSVFAQIRNPNRYILHFQHGTKTWIGVDLWNSGCAWEAVVSYANDQLGNAYGVWSSNLGELRTLHPCPEATAIRALIGAIGCGKLSKSKERKLFKEFSRPLYRLLSFNPETNLWCGWENGATAISKELPPKGSTGATLDTVHLLPPRAGISGPANSLKSV